jgi:hypothetical protein
MFSLSKDAENRGLVSEIVNVDGSRRRLSEHAPSAQAFAQRVIHLRALCCDVILYSSGGGFNFFCFFFSQHTNLTFFLPKPKERNSCREVILTPG